jgi:fermentation-respiration switch protein FrsA (DUF1100 family)
LTITGQGMWHVGLSFLLVAGCAYAGLGLIVFLAQSRMLYFPLRDIETTPRSAGFEYEEIFFEASDGIKLNGWFVPAVNPSGILLFCHGNAGNISHRMDSIRIFRSLGLSTFIFDYRGYGKSGGRPTEKGTYLDAEAAWQYLVEKRGSRPAEIVLFGRSIGGAVAAWLARNHDPRALIMESAFLSVPDIASDLYPFLPVRYLTRFKYNTQEYVRGVRCPVLVVHSREDEIIPFSHGLRLFESASAPKEFLEIRGDHNYGFLLSGKEYEDGLARFLAELPGGRRHTNGAGR